MILVRTIRRPSIYSYIPFTDVLHTYTQHHLRQADARRVMLQVLKYAIGSCSLYLYFIVWIYLSQLYLFRIQFPSVLLYRAFLILSTSFDVFIWEKFNRVRNFISEHTTFAPDTSKFHLQQTKKWLKLSHFSKSSIIKSDALNISVNV